MKFTKYSTGANAFYETAEINGLKAVIHGTNAIHTFDIKLGARFKITIAKDVSNIKDFEVYQVMLSDRLKTAKALAEHFLNVWAKTTSKAL
nr:hypothetical protein [uncultured Campylobacter sp.]